MDLGFRGAEFWDSGVLRSRALSGLEKVLLEALAGFTRFHHQGFYHLNPESGSPFMSLGGSQPYNPETLSPNPTTPLSKP